MDAPTLNHHPQPDHKDIWFLILMFFISVVLLVVLNSCVTQRQRERILKDCVTSSYRKDSIQIQIKERLIPFEVHDTIPYLLPNPCADLCDSLGKLKSSFTAKVKGKNGSNLSLKVKDNELQIEDEVKVKGTVTANDTTKKITSTTKEQVRDNCQREHLTGWDSFWIKTGQILSAIIALVITLLLLKKRG
jgi:hypothetical protein